MAHKSPPIDWHGTVYPSCWEGRFSCVLKCIPVAQWTERDPYGRTMLLCACFGANAAATATLLVAGLSVHACDRLKWTATHHAVYNAQPRTVEVLCAAGADLMARSVDTMTPLERALANQSIGTMQCARVLISNGVRLRSARNMALAPPDLVALEEGVLRFRAAVVALLSLKLRRTRALRVVDKWMVREIGFSIWSTREADLWLS